MREFAFPWLNQFRGASAHSVRLVALATLAFVIETAPVNSAFVEKQVQECTPQQTCRPQQHTSQACSNEQVCTQVSVPRQQCSHTNRCQSVPYSYQNCQPVQRCNGRVCQTFQNCQMLTQYRQVCQPQQNCVQVIDSRNECKTVPRCHEQISTTQVCESHQECRWVTKREEIPDQPAPVATGNSSRISSPPSGSIQNPSYPPNPATDLVRRPPPAAEQEPSLGSRETSSHMPYRSSPSLEDERANGGTIVNSMPHPTPHAMSSTGMTGGSANSVGSMPHPTPHPIDLPATSAGPIANKLNNQIVHAKDSSASPSSAASADCAQLSGGQACSCSGASCTWGPQNGSSTAGGGFVDCSLGGGDCQVNLGYTLSGGQPAFPRNLALTHLASQTPTELDAQLPVTAVYNTPLNRRITLRAPHPMLHQAVRVEIQIRQVVLPLVAVHQITILDQSPS